MTQVNLSLSAIAAACATDVAAAKGYDDKAASCREAANKKIAQLNKAKAKVGRKGQCAIATAFFDALISGGLGKGTAANYLTTFRDAVKTGKPVTDWNPNRKGSKGSAKGKGKGKAKAELATLLLRARNHADWADCCEVIASEYDDAKGSIAEIVDSWLTAQGIELKDAE